MNIYKVTDINTGEVLTLNTEQILDKIYVSRDTLFFHVRTKTQCGGYMFEKIGTDGKTKKPKSETPRQTKTNNGLDEDLRNARLLGLSYGEYKNSLISN